MVKPGTSALVESTRKRSTPSSPSRANAAQVGDPVVERELVHLEVAGVQHQTGVGADRDGEPVGDRVVDRDELAVERAERRAGRPRATSTVTGVIRCSLSLASMKASVSFEPISGDVGALAQQVGHAADVVLVAVGQDDRRRSSSRRSRIQVKSGRMTSTPGWCSSGKSTPQSTMSSRPVVLEDRHVAADLAEPAERDDPQTVGGQRGQRVLAPARAAAAAGAHRRPSAGRAFGAVGRDWVMTVLTRWGRAEGGEGSVSGEDRVDPAAPSRVPLSHHPRVCRVRAPSRKANDPRTESVRGSFCGVSDGT